MTADTPAPGAHRHRRHALAAAAFAAVALAGCAPSGAVPPVEPDPVQRALDTLVHDDAMPAALASVQDRQGVIRDYTAGAGDLATGSPVPPDGRVRIGSNTKTFTAVVVLQLVGEGKVGLDAPVDAYLPGLVRGDGIDGRDITVRQLLQHTSGLPEYGDHIDDDEIRHRYAEPRDLLDIALKYPATSAPGARWAYSNTDYIVAGMLVERVTGRPLAEEIGRRIIAPLGLHDTYWPVPGDMTIQGPHPLGYHRNPADGPLREFTGMDPSWGWAAGQLISTGDDLDRFFTALLGGRLLKPAQLAAMRTTVPIPGPSGLRYGLGLISRPLSCGGVYWGHGGDIPGFETRGGATEDGRAVTVAVTSIPFADAAAQHVLDAVDAALCR